MPNGSIDDFLNRFKGIITNNVQSLEKVITCFEMNNKIFRFLLMEYNSIINLIEIYKGIVVVKIWPSQDDATCPAVKSLCHSRDTSEAVFYPEDAFIPIALMLSVILKLLILRYQLRTRLTATDHLLSPPSDDNDNRSPVISTSVYSWSMPTVM